MLALSAMPSWFGEKPAIEIKLSQTNEHLNSPFKLSSLLEGQGVDSKSIKLENNVAQLVFDNEVDQTKARNVLGDWVGKDDTMSYSYTSVAPQWLQSMALRQ
ncbi:protein-export membrane protein SecD [Vibrio variabilis]|uniref:Protein-export membrane protein SecD n=1 Tax=Vibrio variabilis TaxID=990271 RepID=A0ABQ0JNK1_9VIBR|nr:protein-export membrane protein SecD [Vibrio variabilis]